MSRDYDSADRAELDAQEDMANDRGEPAHEISDALRADLSALGMEI
jgi:hypothetical protein